MIDTSDIGAFLGLDVGKGEHHATALTPAGKKAFARRLPNSEPKLREVFAKLIAKHRTVLVVVDQPASIGALPLAVARDAGCKVAYPPGLTMRRIADLQIAAATAPTEEADGDSRAQSRYAALADAVHDEFLRARAVCCRPEERGDSPFWTRRRAPAGVTRRAAGATPGSSR